MTTDGTGALEAGDVGTRKPVKVSMLGRRDASFEYRNRDRISHDAVPLERICVRYFQQHPRAAASTATAS